MKIIEYTDHFQKIHEAIMSELLKRFFRAHPIKFPETKLNYELEYECWEHEGKEAVKRMVLIELSQEEILSGELKSVEWNMKDK